MEKTLGSVIINISFIKSIKSIKMVILESADSICYNMPRQNDMNAPFEQRKTHEFAPRGFFYSILARRLIP